MFVLSCCCCYFFLSFLLLIIDGLPLILSLFKDFYFVFEVRDLWPEIPISLGILKNKLIIILAKLLEKTCYRRANLCVGLSPGICKAISKVNGSDDDIIFIPNSSDLDIFYPIDDFSLKDSSLIPCIEENKFVAIFAGAHGICNGLDILLDTAKELIDLGRNDIEILFVGEGRCKSNLVNRAYSEGLTNCHFLSSIPKTELAKLIRESISVGLMILKNNPSFYMGTSPNKFFDYISSGIPVVINYPGWLKEIVDNNQLGISVEPCNHKELAYALITLADDRGMLIDIAKNVRIKAEKSFNRNLLNMKLKSELEDRYQIYKSLIV